MTCRRRMAELPQPLRTHNPTRPHSFYPFHPTQSLPFFITSNTKQSPVNTVPLSFM